MPSASQPKHSGYFEAVIQLRPARKDILDLVYRIIKKRPLTRIAKEEDLDAGKNIFISDQKTAFAIGRQLKRQFKGTLTVSRTLRTFDRETSKNVYSVTVLFRLNQ